MLEQTILLSKFFELFLTAVGSIAAVQRNDFIDVAERFRKVS
jgi:hypothetical protein